MMTNSALENDTLYSVCTVALAGRPVGTRCTPKLQMSLLASDGRKSGFPVAGEKGSPAGEFSRRPLLQAEAGRVVYSAVCSTGPPHIDRRANAYADFGRTTEERMPEMNGQACEVKQADCMIDLPQRCFPPFDQPGDRLACVVHFVLW